MSEIIKKIFKSKFSIFFLFVILFGYWSILYVTPIEWDFLCYHYHNGWAFLNNRINIDFLPAFFRSYFNPVLDSFIFLLIQKLNNHPYIFLFCSSIKLSVFMFLSYLIADLTFINDKNSKTSSIVVCLLITFFSPLVLHSINFSVNDMFHADIILLGFYLHLKTIFYNKQNDFITFIIFLLFGIVIGLKYTAINILIGIFCCLLYFHKKIKNPLKYLSIAILGIITGFILSDGWWMYTLYKHFRNPFFPYFNNIFHSPMADYSGMMGMDYAHIRPKSILEYIFAPLLNTRRFDVGMEINFQDIKIQLTFVLMVMFTFINKFYTNIRNFLNNFAQIDVLYTIIIFTITSYYFNLLLFGNMRYVLFIFPLISIFLVAVCNIFAQIMTNNIKEFYKNNLFLIILLIISNLNFLYITNFGIFNLFVKLIPIYAIIFLCLLPFGLFTKSKNLHICLAFLIIAVFGQFYFAYNNMNPFFARNIIKIRDIGFKDNSLVLCGTMPTSIVIPSQNPKAKYMGISAPHELFKDAWYNQKTLFKNFYYENKYLENIVKDEFAKNKDVYIIFEMTSVIRDFDLYNKLINLYADRKIDNIFGDNCQSFKFRSISSPSNRTELIACKIK